MVVAPLLKISCPQLEGSVSRLGSVPLICACPCAVPCSWITAASGCMIYLPCFRWLAASAGTWPVSRRSSWLCARAPSCGLSLQYRLEARGLQQLQQAGSVLWCPGLVVLRHVRGLQQTRASEPASCVGRGILIHCPPEKPCCNSVMAEAGNPESSSNLDFLFQDCLTVCRSLIFHMHFRVSLSLSAESNLGF